MTEELQKIRKIPAFGFKSCGDRQYCTGCEYYIEGDLFRDRTCRCPENIEIPDYEARAFLLAYATGALYFLREALQNMVDEQLKKEERKDNEGPE